MKKRQYGKKVVAWVATFAMVMSLFISPAVVSADTATNEAQIGGTPYATLAAAFAAANDGQEIDVLKAVEVPSTIVFNTGKAVTLDLNGYTIKNATTATSGVIHVKNGGKLTVKDSTVTAKATADGYSNYTGGKIIANPNLAIKVYGQQTPANWSSTPIYSEVIVENGALEGNSGAIAVFGNGAKATVKDGYLVGYNNAAIAGNGSCTTSTNNGGTTMNLNGGVFIGKMSEATPISMGVYHPQAGTLNIDGATIISERGAGIVIRNGVLNMNSGTIITKGGTFTGGAGDATPKLETNGIAVDFSSSYNHNNSDREVNITGGSITASSGIAAVKVYDFSTNKTDGTVISGGTFSTDPSAYLAADKITYKNASGTYAVAKKVITPPTVDVPTVPTKPTGTVETGIKDATSKTAVAEVTATVINTITTTKAVDETTRDKVSAAIGAGKSVTSEVVSKAVTPSQVDTAVQQKIIAAVEKSAVKNNNAATIVQYLDLGINLKTDNEVLGSINELSTPITFVVVIPAEENVEGRIFYAVRYHNGVADRIDLERNPDGTYNLTTDRFSTYAIAYEEAPTAGRPGGSVATPRTVQGRTGGGTVATTGTIAKATTTAKTSIVQTGDENQLGVYVAVGLASIIACLGLVIQLRKREE